MPFLRRIFPTLFTLLIVLSLAGCHSSSNRTQAANEGPSGGQAVNGVDSSASNPGPPNTETQPVTIPARTEIDVRLLNSLSSVRNHQGDAFEATVAEPVVVDGRNVIPQGTDVTGRVLVSRPSGHLKTPAELSVTLATIQVNGETYDLQTSEITRRGASHAKHDAKWIGGLAGAGGLLGALVGHGKGAAIGAGLGAGAGTATAYETGKQNIYLPPETRMTFVLREPLTVPVAG